MILSFISFLTKSGKIFVTIDVAEIQWTVKGKRQEKSLNESKISDVTVNLTCSTEQRAAWETFSLSSTHFYSALRFIPLHIKAQGSSISWTRLINALQPSFFKFHFRTILPSVCTSICLQIGIYPSELAGEYLVFIRQLSLHVCYVLCLPIVNLIILIFFYAAFNISILEKAVCPWCKLLSHWGVQFHEDNRSTRDSPGRHGIAPLSGTKVYTMDTQPSPPGSHRSYRYRHN